MTAKGSACFFCTLILFLTFFLPKTLNAQSDADLLRQTLNQYQQDRASIVSNIKGHEDSITQLHKAASALSNQISGLINEVSTDQHADAEADEKVSSKEGEITATRKPLDEAIADEQEVGGIVSQPNFHTVNRNFQQVYEPNDEALSAKFQLVKDRDASTADAINKVCTQRCEKQTPKQFKVQCEVTNRPFWDCSELQKATGEILSKAVAKTNGVRKEVQPKLDQLNAELGTLKDAAEVSHKQLAQDRAALNFVRSQLSSTNDQINRLNGELPGLRARLVTVEWNIAHPPRDCGMRAFNYACAGAQLTSFHFSGCRTHCQPGYKGSCIAASCTDTSFTEPICGACVRY